MNGLAGAYGSFGLEDRGRQASNGRPFITRKRYAASAGGMALVWMGVGLV